MDEVSKGAREDFATTAVPLDRRYSALSMGLLWITMVSGFPAVLIGFEWQKAGYSLIQCLSGALISCGVLLTYAIVSSQLGARTGLNFALLTRSVFGIAGSHCISVLQTFLFLIWYALIANFVAIEISGLFPSPVPIQLIAAVAAVLMAANNLFGFAGVANFAKYFAAPIIIVWIFVLFAKTSAMTPSMVWHEPGKVPFLSALSVISSFVIGYSVWGNEPDFWRFAKPKLWTNAVPLIISILIGQIIFPISGWMLSRLVNVGDMSTATGAVTNFSMAGAPLLAALVLTASYFAAGDANLYGAINSIENLRAVNRSRLVITAMFFTAAVAVVLSYYGKAFEILSSFNSILLPCVTIVLCCDHYLLGQKSSTKAQSPKPYSLRFRIPAVCAVLLGWTVGIFSAGVIPGAQILHNGIWPLYAWLTSLLVYLLLRRKF